MMKDHKNSEKAVNLNEGYVPKDSIREEDYYTAAEYAKVHGRVPEQVKFHARNGRIEGAIQVGKGGSWMIPKNAPYPGVSIEKIITEDEIDLDQYVSAKEYADIHKKSENQIKSFLRNGRIEGAIKVGTHRKWMIPKDAPYPTLKKR